MPSPRTDNHHPGGSPTAAPAAGGATGVGAQLIAAATRVAELGCVPAQLAALTDAELEDYQRTVAELMTHTKTFATLGAGEIARRSVFEAGYTGMSRRHGHSTPEAHIQAITGGKLDDARELVAVGTMGIAHDNAAAAADELGIDLATATSADLVELSQVPAFVELAGPDTIWQAPPSWMPSPPGCWMRRRRMRSGKVSARWMLPPPWNNSGTWPPTW